MKLNVPRVFFLVVALFAGLSFFAPSGEGAEKFPRPAGAVNDFANIIPNAYRQRMDALAREVLAKTGTSVVVATVPTIGDNDPADYANRLYQSWGIGKKGEDKGVLIFLALKERQVRIETGYGVEGILPDGRVGAILDRDVEPFLRKGEYGRGLLNAMLDVAAVVADDAKASIGERRVVPQPRRGMEGLPREKGASWAGTLVSLLILAVLFGLLLATPQGRSLLPLILLMFLGGGRGGGGFGGFGGGGFGGFGGGSSGGGGAGRGF